MNALYHTGSGKYETKSAGAEESHRKNKAEDAEPAEKRVVLPGNAREFTRADVQIPCRMGL